MKTYAALVTGWMMCTVMCFSCKESTGQTHQVHSHAGVTGKNVRLSELPALAVFEKDGCREGLSAAYGGVLGDRIVVAGGCNFPEKPAAEGGPKVYYDDIYVLNLAEAKGAKWEPAGRMPEKVANGASITLPEGIVCVGGVNAAGALNKAWLLRWEEGRQAVVAEALPALPVAMDNLTGASDGKAVYVSGGNVDGKPGKRCFVLEGLHAAEWKEIAAYPGPARLQPVGFVAEGKYYMMGGFQPATAEEESVVSTDGVCYDPANGQWSFVGDILPRGETVARTLVGAAGLVMNNGLLVCQGGVNRAVFKAAVDRPLLQQRAAENKQDSVLARLKREQAQYMKHSPEWYRFNRQLLLYDVKTGVWEAVGDFEELARAGAVMVNYKDKLVIVNGERKPGIRSAGVYMIDLGNGWK